jgi:hypothetical protein
VGQGSLVCLTRASNLEPGVANFLKIAEERQRNLLKALGVKVYYADVEDTVSRRFDRSPAMPVIEETVVNHKALDNMEAGTPADIKEIKDFLKDR